MKVTYDMLVKAKGADSLAGVKSRVCQACRATMTETQFLELRMDMPRTCTTCGRLQYPIE